MRRAQALQIRASPEQRGIAAMRHTVIDMPRRLPPEIEPTGAAAHSLSSSGCHSKQLTVRLTQVIRQQRQLRIRELRQHQTEPLHPTMLLVLTLQGHPPLRSLFKQSHR
jgi:hypothetical protein